MFELLSIFVLVSGFFNSVISLPNPVPAPTPQTQKQVTQVPQQNKTYIKPILPNEFQIDFSELYSITPKNVQLPEPTQPVNDKCKDIIIQGQNTGYKDCGY